MTIYRMLYTGLFGKADKSKEPKELDIDEGCTITNYESSENKPRNSIKVVCNKGSIFLEEGAKNDESLNIADFSEKKANVLEKIAALAGDKKTLSKEDISQVNESFVKEWGLLEIKALDSGVLILKWAENDILRIDFSNSRDTSVEKNKGKSGYHIVQSGDTLSAIAKKYGVSTQALCVANSIQNANQLSLGQKIKIPTPTENTTSSVNSVDKETQSTKTVSSVSSSPSIQPVKNNTTSQAYQFIHVVKQGDTLEGLAKRNKLFIWELRRANPQVKDWLKLQIGQKLNIPTPTSLTKWENLSESERAFLNTLKSRESGGEKDPQRSVNKYGYMGLYQIGYEILKNFNVYNNKKWNPDNRFKIKNQKDFLDSSEKQLQVTVASMQHNWDYLTVGYKENTIYKDVEFNIEKYIGKSIEYNGKQYKVTHSGILAAAHLLGPDKVIAFLRNPKTTSNMRDGMGTHITEYLLMKDFDLSNMLDID